MFDDIDFHRSLRLALDALGFEQATPVQAETVPAALTGRDLHVTAETGSGKTLAYLVPAIEKILALPGQAPEGTLALVLVPTRELSRQVLKETRTLLRQSRLSAAGITGGADFKYQRALLRKDPEIVVGTPGRILEHCQKGSMALDALQTLVLDEADRMLDLGFRDDVTALAERSSPQRQTLMLSATPGHGGVKQVAGRLLREPLSLEIDTARAPHSAISHQRVLADSESHKDKLLLALTQPDLYRRVLVFANKRATAVRLNNLLRTDGRRSATLHGEMRTEQRKQVLTQFHDNKVDILCASDVAARGLDIKDIECVINYDLPRSGDDYLHRTGRTGRAGAQGLAVSLVSAAEWNLMISISRYLGLEFEHRTVPGLKAKYNGPKRQKSDGRAAGKKKKKGGGGQAKKAGKPRKTAAGKPGRTRSNTGEKNDGFAPLKKRR